jgi:DNA polymerase Ligase (LigD)
MIPVRKVRPLPSKFRNLPENLAVMLRYVVLTHDFPSLHWDLMLENEASLRTWRLSAPADSSGGIEALLLAPHRLAYLDYEGPVSGGRGTVARWDTGTYTTEHEAGSRLVIVLEGNRLSGRVSLDATEPPDRWRYRYVRGAT